ncbi:tetratricopeptide repeat protein [Telmatobacter sp. DSM 110680]|uniref:Tetratricopeptide repeat protein n=1 Tax=Telmatobacter sp. DSM 110680 TaxID=3036704 RepID=A0AAU7DI85_9BACT
MKSIHIQHGFFATAMAIAAITTTALAQTNPGQVAFSLEREGKLAEAETAWSALAKQYPTNPEPLAHMGLIESKQEHYAEAIKFYKRAMVLNPSMPGLRLNLGIALFKAGDYRGAITYLDPLLKAQPTDQRLTLLIGMSHYGLEDFANASPLLQEASKNDPENLTLLLTLAHSCLLAHRYPCVVDAYHRLIALNAESAEADMLVGEALDEMKDPEGALREFRSAIAVGPKEPNVHFGLGYLLWKKGQYPEAAQEFQAEIANDPHHVQAMLYLADARMQMNQMDEARLLLEKIEKTDPDIAMQHVDLGIVYADEDRKQDAKAEFETAVKLAPKNVNAHYRLARLYRSMGMTSQAKVEFDKASGLNKAEDDRLLKIMSTIPGGKDASGVQKPAVQK